MCVQESGYMGVVPREWVTRAKGERGIYDKILYGCMCVCMSVCVCAGRHRDVAPRE